MEQPLVTCITPTADRQKFLPLAIQYFLAQDYPNKEMVILDDGKYSNEDLIPDDPSIRYIYSADKLGTIGMKRNLAIEKAKGDMIVMWDDDDYYAPDWISRHVNAQYETGANLTGLNNVMFYSPTVNERYRYQDLDEKKPWLCGATMAFSKSVWEQHKFVDLQVGEDYDFVWNAGAKIHPLNYLEGFVAILHPHNTSLKPVEDPKHKKHPEPWTAGIGLMDEGLEEESKL